MKRLRFYAYERHSEEQSVLRLVDLSEVPTQIGPEEPVQQRTLHDLTLPPGMEVALAAAAIRSAEGIEILEETDD